AFPRFNVLPAGPAAELVRSVSGGTSNARLAPTSFQVCPWCHGGRPPWFSLLVRARLRPWVGGFHYRYGRVYRFRTHTSFGLRQASARLNCKLDRCTQYVARLGRDGV